MGLQIGMEHNLLCSFISEIASHEWSDQDKHCLLGGIMEWSNKT